jgi:hypothetical protein
MTPEQRELARHALGLPNKTGKSYRNWYAVEDGHEATADWDAMVSTGLATASRKVEWMAGEYVFRLTRYGAELALKSGEQLCQEDFPEPTTKE